MQTKWPWLIEHSSVMFVSWEKEEGEGGGTAERVW